MTAGGGNIITEGMVGGDGDDGRKGWYDERLKNWDGESTANPNEAEFDKPKQQIAHITNCTDQSHNCLLLKTHASIIHILLFFIFLWHIHVLYRQFFESEAIV